MPVDVAAVVVTYNSENHIDELLDTIPAAAAGLTYSVVVVDNGSVDGTLDAPLDQRSDCTGDPLDEPRLRGRDQHRRRRVPDAEAILILNPDATLDPECVPRMLDVLRKPGNGIVAPRVREADGSLSPTLRRGPTLGAGRRPELHATALFPGAHRRPPGVRDRT